MASDLTHVRLGQIAQINPRRAVKKGVYVSFIDMAAISENRRDIDASDISRRLAKAAGAHFSNGDTLLARITPCLENGKTSQVRCLGDSEIAEGSTEFIVLCGIDLQDNDFVYYLCRDPAFREYAIGRMEGTSGRQRVSWQSIANYTFLSLSKKERKEIASILSALDDRITLLRETSKTLEAIAQAMFKSWFIDFDPVRAKRQGRIPTGMNEETAALFPDELVESELGLIPKGWKVGTLADLSNLNPESWVARKKPHRLMYVDLANAKENVILEIVEYEFDKAPSRAKRVLRSGDTIIGTVRPGNRSFAFIWQPVENLTGSTGFAVLRPGRVENTEYVYLAATQKTSIEQLAHLADGGAYPAVRPEVVAQLSCVIPGEAVMQSFHGVVDVLLQKISTNQQQSQTLTELRDTLLPRLISGKLRIADAELEEHT